MEMTEDKPVWYFVFNSEKLLVKITGDTLNVPIKTTLADLKVKILTKFYLGKLGVCDCYCIEIPDQAVVPEGMSFKKFRSLLGKVDEETFMLAGKAYQILHWDKKTQYCGSCGSPTVMKSDERAKVCPQCGNISYPRISPAVIVAIIKGNEILLARANYFKGNLHSLIAGFVEPGETFEACVQREVFEEVGLKVQNIKYFGSQPWPFPDSLMVGFTAEYASGEILVDGNEIASAGWFTKEDLPEVPNNSSIAGKIIDWFLALQF